MWEKTLEVLILLAVKSGLSNASVSCANDRGGIPRMVCVFVCLCVLQGNCALSSRPQCKNTTGDCDLLIIGGGDIHCEREENRE
jgi:hypothetical protein